FWEVSVRAEEESERGEEEAGHHHGQGSEVSPRHRRARLQLSHEARARMAVRRRQSESDDLVSRTRDDAPRTGRAHPGTTGKRLSRHRRCRDAAAHGRESNVYHLCAEET